MEPIKGKCMKMFLPRISAEINQFVQSSTCGLLVDNMMRTNCQQNDFLGMRIGEVVMMVSVSKTLVWSGKVKLALCQGKVCSCRITCVTRRPNFV